MLNDAILSRQRHHVRILLDEIDQDRGLLHEYPWNMRTVLHSRSAAILRDILTRHPEALPNMRHCDPLLIMEVCNWPTEACLLVEAGAKIEGTVPPKFVGLLSLSLEDRCRIVVRRHMKLLFVSERGPVTSAGEIQTSTSLLLGLILAEVICCEFSAGNLESSVERRSRPV